jgi:sulfatase modifying factor 1
VSEPEPLILTAADVDALLDALALNGFVVDAHRGLRLHFLVRQAVALPAERWFAVLAAVMLTEQDPARHEAAATRLGAVWATFAAARTRRLTEAPTPTPRVASEATGRVSRGIPQWARGVLALVVVLGLSALFLRRSPPPPMTPDAGPSASAPAPDTAPAPVSGGIVWGTTPGTFRYPTPIITPAPTPVFHRWPFALLGLVALAAAVYAATRRGLAEHVLAAEESPVFLTRPAPTPPGDQTRDRCLERGDREALVQGAGRFASDEPSRTLDLLESARATAEQGGILAARFLRQRFDREVWLWVDSLTEHAEPRIRRHVEEVERALERSGLTTRVRRFYGLPASLVDENRRAEALVDLADYRPAVRVAVITDGAEVAARLSHPLRSREARVTLGELALWPDLAFFDPSGDACGLALALEPWRATPRPMTALVEFLGGGVRPSRPDASDPLQARLWRAVVAAYPALLDEAVVVEAARALNLGVGGAQVGVLGLDASAAGRLRGSDATCAEDTAWLAAILPARMAEAVEHWEATATRWLAEAAEDERGAATRDLREQELACVRLWSPDATRLHAAAVALARRGGRLAPVIAERLEKMAPLGRSVLTDKRNLAIGLPWRWQTLEPETRALLHAVGLGRQVCAPLSLQTVRPSRVFAAAAAAGVVALAAVGVARWWPDPPPVTDPPSLGDGAVGSPTPDSLPARIVEAPAGVFTLRYGRRVESTRALRPGDVVTVDWTQTRSCVFEVPGEATRWACGQDAERADAPGWSGAQVVLESPMETNGEPGEDARRLAVALLDTGVAATVAFIDAETPGARVAGPSPALVVSTVEATLPPGVRMPRTTAADWAPLAKVLMPKGRMVSLETAWPTVRAANVGGLKLPMVPRCENEGDCRPKMVQAPAGAFWMGSPEGIGENDEHPRHRVELSAFLVGATEVTQAQYEAVMGENPSPFQGEHGGGPMHPVGRVNWFQAVAYCNRLSELEGMKPAYVVKDRRGMPWPPKEWDFGRDREDLLENGQASESLPIVESDPSADGYRLPTEAEWEYATRAGTETRYWSGNGEEDLARVAWYFENSDDKSHPVGEKPANAWGLHDVHGNVMEWTNDWFAADAYTQETVKDPPGPPTGRGRVSRSGSFKGDSGRTRAADRFGLSPGIADVISGFRVVRPAP